MSLLQIVQTILEDAKAADIVILPVAELTAITDTMVVCSGTSSRHVQSIADRLVEGAKHAGHQPLSVTGQESGEWILVDLDEIVVHIMQPVTRTLYDLEKLWDVTLAQRSEPQA